LPYNGILRIGWEWLGLPDIQTEVEPNGSSDPNPTPTQAITESRQEKTLSKTKARGSNAPGFN